MITREYFESGKPFEFKGKNYKKRATSIAVEEDSCWIFHGNVKSITSVGVIVTSELFGQETASLIKFEDLTETI